METFINNGIINVTTILVQQPVGGGSYLTKCAELAGIGCFILMAVQGWQARFREALRPQGAA